MARVNGRSNKSLSTTRPVLTSDSRCDWALWQLSSTLAEIAEQAARKNNDGSANTEKITHQKMIDPKAFPEIKDDQNV